MTTHTLTAGEESIPNAEFNIETKQFVNVPGTLSEDGKIYTYNDKNIWSVEPPVILTEGGRKRRSFKKSKKGGNKHTMGGRKSKKCKKGGKRSSKKSRRH
jgi:hypothetical protein